MCDNFTWYPILFIQLTFSRYIDQNVTACTLKRYAVTAQLLMYTRWILVYTWLRHTFGTLNRWTAVL